jgi:hypothetical protein
VLFSQPEIAGFLSDSFECAWESVRPVPRLSIDFGDGRELERTLRGNIATYVCTSAGETFDLVPGLVSGAQYVARLREALALFGALREERFVGDDRAAERRARAVADWHRALVEPTNGPGDFLIEPPAFAVSRPDNMSKMSVELLLEMAVARAIPRFAGEEPAAGPDQHDAWNPSPLELDDMHARARGYRAAHQFLAARALTHPAALTHDVYRELLHVDLADPYLGLAPDVLGGEVGRH